MQRALPVVLLLLASAPGRAGERPVVHPFEVESGAAQKNIVDEAVRAALLKRGIRPANRCSDEVFVRRVYLDVIGTLPKPGEVLRFLDDRGPDKRRRLIEALLARDEFAEYWSLKWCDLLRVKAEFPINLWPNAVQAYHRWIHDSIRLNRPYDRMARTMLTASGSNFREPAVNFWRAAQSREPVVLAQAVAVTFMGTRLDRWPQARQAEMAAFFSRVAFKRTVEWKEEIVFPSPAPARSMWAVFPDGTGMLIRGNTDPRRAFADWLIRRDNAWFAPCVVNRIWAWLMGRGIVHEPDDIRPDNPASNPELLAALSRELVVSGYDLRRIYRLILNSATYQQSCVPRATHPAAEAQFAHYVVRRLDAEVLIDAICSITGTNENYASPIPEPFTFLPEDDRTIALGDGSISSPFLEMFGRPTRDTGLWSERGRATTGAQRLHLLNSSDIQRRIERSTRLAAVLRNTRRDTDRGVRALYLLILSRHPLPAEMQAVRNYARSSGLNGKQVMDDLVWTLINSKEFLYAH
ncbi:MAG: DUF1553 domain-containing protein [Planctomycetota bacterium]|jgi:hypothetical protein